MKRISNEKLSAQRMMICDRKGAAKSDEETERLLMDIKKVWGKNVSLEVLKFVFNEWQDRYDSERINQLCAELLENGIYDKEWINLWKRWMTAVDIPWTVSGTAYAHCLYNKEIYDDWLLKNRINKNSRLGNEVEELYNCFVRNQWLCAERKKIMGSDKIVKITIEYKKYKAVYENTLGITRLDLIQFPADAEVTLRDNIGRECRIRFDSLCSLKLGDASSLMDDEKEAAEMLLDGQNYNFAVDEIFVSEKKCPVISYTDATEQILLGLPSLTAEIINGTTKGLWSHSGERLIVVNIKNFPFESEKINCRLVFTDYDSNKTYSELVADARRINSNESDSDVFLCSLDTKIFDDYMFPEYSKVTMKGVFRASNMPKSGETSVTYEFPVSLVINNSAFFEAKNKNLCIDTTSKVSIDFGTSSTCAAIKTNIISMIEMTPDLDGKSPYSVYENPTNLMIYRWKELAEKWNNERCQPLVRKLNVDYPEYSPGLFDFGHAVKGMNIEDQRSLDAVINQLKMIPQLIETGKKFRVRDFENSDEVELDCGSDNDCIFDPIMFYGYLLGKAVNHPNGNENKYYTQYYLSYPVKFSSKIRKTIESSLTEGILRSLPESVRKLTDKKGKKIFSVKMKYSEPIACIGAACGEELVIKDDKPCLFGVFDFGGGTADYSFGMYRNADVDTEGAYEALELFDVDGDDSFGGELIISKISYWILTDPEIGNKEAVIKNCIPFEKPDDELIEDGFGNLILSTIGAAANISKLNELISRPFFEGNPPGVNFESDDICSFDDEKKRYEYQGTTMVRIDELFSVSSENPKVSVDLKIDFDVLDRKLKELFQEKCQAFSKSMDNAFTKSESEKKMAQAGASYDKSRVQILMSGNSSRHPLIKEFLKEVVGTDNICLLGENRNDTDKNRYKVTPKTAVAIGALKLDQMRVYQPKAISNIYVAVERKRELEVLPKGDFSDKTWQKAGTFTDGRVTVYTSTTPSVENRLLWKNHDLVCDDYDDDDDDNIMVCYIRQCGSDEIEYIALPLGIDPDENDDEYEIKKEKIN